MQLPEEIQNKIFSAGHAVPGMSSRAKDKKIVFTNGCFDVLHPGHLHLLSEARNMGDLLVVGLNTDRSVTRLKGPERPVNDENARASMLASLVFVDRVVLFDEDTPEKLIRTIRPDVLVKGGDYRSDEIVGHDFVTSYGGKVVIVPLIKGYSSSAIIRKIDRA